MKKVYFLLSILLFQQSFGLEWNPWATLGSSLNLSKEFLFRLVFPKKDIAYYSKKLNEKINELNKKNYTPPGYKIGSVDCLKNPWNTECNKNNIPTTKPQVVYGNRLDAIRKYFQEEIAKCMKEKNKNLENEFVKLRNELGLPTTINPLTEKNVKSMCKGNICPLGVCKATGRCKNNNDVNKANRMQKILDSLPGAFKPCAEVLLKRKY